MKTHPANRQDHWKLYMHPGLSLSTGCQDKFNPSGKMKEMIIMAAIIFRKNLAEKYWRQFGSPRSNFLQGRPCPHLWLLQDGSVLLVPMLWEQALWKLVVWQTGKCSKSHAVAREKDALVPGSEMGSSHAIRLIPKGLACKSALDMAEL